MLKRRVFVVFLILAVCVASAAAAEARPVKSVIYPLESSIYDDMDALYSICGLARPSTNRPWSDAEARSILDRVDAAGLTGVASKLYDRILSVLDEGLRWKFGDDFQMNVGMDFGLEMYAHSNTEDFTTEDDWVRGYQDRRSLMRARFEFTASDYFYTASDIHYKWSRADYNDTFGNQIADGHTSNDGYIASYRIDDTAYYIKKSYAFSQGFFTSFFTNTMNFSFIWPKQAIFSLGGDTWNLSVNRDRLSLGNARFANLLVDDHHFSDYARLSVFGKYFKYDWVLMFLNTIVTDNEQNAAAEGRVFMIHTLQFRILDIASLTISENVMYKYSTAELLYANPSFIFHNLNNRSMFNALAYAEVNVTPLPGLELRFQFALDQARAPHEGDSQSDSSGFVAGIEYTCVLGNGYLTSYAEYAQTTPLLYRRDKIDFVRVNRYWSHGALDDSFWGGHVPFFDYIGFPYGGDCRLLEIRSTYSGLDHWSASLFLRGIDHGIMNIYMSHNVDGYNDEDANYRGDTPSGDVISRTVIMGLEFEADLDSLLDWPGFSFSGELDWINRWSFTKATKEYSGHQADLQFSLGVTISI